MAVSLDELTTALLAETAELERVLLPLDAAGWRAPTPAAGWTVHDQIGHLTYFDTAATLAAQDPERFRAERETAIDTESFIERIVEQWREAAPGDVLAAFGRARAAMIAVLGAMDPSARVPWYGPDMSVASSLTARIMETWAHGQDVYDALGVAHPPTDALRHVAYIGVRTLPNSFVTRGLDVPAAPVFVSLRAPDGEEWTWGDAAAPDQV